MTATSAPTNAAIVDVMPARPQRLAGPGQGDGDAEPGAGGDAEQVRVGERVAERRLVAAAGRGEDGPDEPGQHDAGQADLGDDGGQWPGRPWSTSTPGSRSSRAGRPGSAAPTPGRTSRRRGGDQR